jgi:flagellar hook assembly protein FlgD
LFGTAVKENLRGDLPANFQLSQNYPNPFDVSQTSTTRIEISFPTPPVPAHDLRLEIFDALGRVVRSYSFSSFENAAVEWDGKNANGALVPAGIYVYRLTNDNFANSRRLMLLH